MIRGNTESLIIAYFWLGGCSEIETLWQPARHKQYHITCKECTKISC